MKAMKIVTGAALAGAVALGLAESRKASTRKSRSASDETQSREDTVSTKSERVGASAS